MPLMDALFEKRRVVRRDLADGGRPTLRTFLGPAGNAGPIGFPESTP